MGCGAKITNDYQHGTQECLKREEFNAKRAKPSKGNGFCPVGHDYSLQSKIMDFNDINCDICGVKI